MLFFVVRLFFIMILTSVVLSAALGWLAIARAKFHLGKAFGPKHFREKEQQDKSTVIEGEYKVLSEDEKK